MGHHFHKHILVLVFFFWTVCTGQQEFLKCISTQSEAKIESFIHTLNSSKYYNLYRNAQKNARWLNSTTSKKPLLIVAPNVEAEVQVTVLCSQVTGLQIRVKSGGHDYEGLSFQGDNEFVMIDLNNLKQIDINVKEDTAWIQTGVTLGELYYAISLKSKVHAFAGGLYPTVGSGGHISGGGQGTILRKYGLAADNVIDARVVDADGRILDRKSMGEDLFWALRGGGGCSFGVILAWKLKLARVPEEVTVFTVRRKLDTDALGLLQKWQNISYQLPEDLFIRILTQNKIVPPAAAAGEEEKLIVQLSYQGLYLGKAKDLIALMKQTFPEFELNKISDCLKQPKSTTKKDCKSQTPPPFVRKECFQVSWIKSVLYFAGLSVKENVTYLVDATSIKTPPLYYKAKSDFLIEPIPDEGWEIIKNAFLQVENPMMILDPYGGKMSKISVEEIPFPYRDGITHNVQYLVKWNNNEDEEQVKKHLEWMKNFYKKMERFVTSSPRAAYVNYKDLDLGQNNQGFSYWDAEEWGEKYFAANFARLAKIKSRVDPQNFFRNEQTIPPLHVV